MNRCTCESDTGYVGSCHGQESDGPVSVSHEWTADDREREAAVRASYAGQDVSGYLPGTFGVPFAKAVRS